MTIDELKPLVDQLITLGEDQDELNYWLTIYPDLPEDAQTELIQNLQAELDELTKSA